MPPLCYTAFRQQIAPGLTRKDAVVRLTRMWKCGVSRIARIHSRRFTEGSRKAGYTVALVLVELGLRNEALPVPTRCLEHYKQAGYSSVPRGAQRRTDTDANSLVGNG
jgi:hypothetical protein